VGDAETYVEKNVILSPGFGETFVAAPRALIMVDTEMTFTPTPEMKAAPLYANKRTVMTLIKPQTSGGRTAVIVQAVHSLGIPHLRTI